MLSLLGSLNAPDGCSRHGFTLKSGAFLLLYNLFNAGTAARVHATDSSASFATLLLPFLSGARL